jgi:hypothetical protein
MKSQKTGQEKFAESSRIFSGAIKFASQCDEMLLWLSHFSTQFNQFRALIAGAHSSGGTCRDHAKRDMHDRSMCISKLLLR